MTSLHPALSWRPLADSDLPAIAELAGVCLAADGGQPFAASAGFVRQSYLAGAETTGGWDAGELICVSALRRPSPAAPAGGAGPGTPAGGTPAGGIAGGPARPAVTTGLVHPRWRRRGVGGTAFDWAASAWAAGPSGPGGLQAETEALSDAAHALYLSRAMRQIFAEDIMQLPATAQLPAASGPPGLTLSQWSQPAPGQPAPGQPAAGQPARASAGPARFFAVYAAAFGDRPGFPGWPQQRWAEWISADDDFRPELTLLATVRGADTGFIVGDAAGWIAQMGVAPAARGQGIGARLISEAVRLMRAAGESTITLNVNADNPHAIALYRRLGFIRAGRRAKYRAPA